MTRNWLTYVAITASLIAGFICSTAFADNKGMKFSGGSSPGHSMQFQQSNNAFRNLGNIQSSNFGGLQNQLKNNNIQGIQTQIRSGNIHGGQPGQILGGIGKPQIKTNPGTQIFNGNGNGQGNGIGGIKLGNDGLKTTIGKQCHIAPKCIDPCFNKGCSPCLKNWNPLCTPWWWTCCNHYHNCPIYYPVYTTPIIVTVPVAVGVPVIEEKLVQVPVGSTITMQALGLGNVPGRLIVVMDKVSFESQIVDWKLDAVTATLPMFNLAAPALAELVIVKADGQPATSMKVELIPAQPVAAGAVQQAQALEPAGELSAAAALAR